jgi:hypothetical protein
MRNFVLILVVASLRRVFSISEPPNIVIFLVDDLGWNQVGYHAEKVGNSEIVTPNIDQYAQSGIEMDRGYMTPWCGPSRAALITGRTNVYNGVSSDFLIKYLLYSTKKCFFILTCLASSCCGSL